MVGNYLFIFSIIIFITTIIILIIKISKKYEKERIKKLKQICLEKGFDFNNNFSFSHLEEKNFKIFNIGSYKKIHNVLINKEEKILDYSYLISTGKSTTRVYHTIYFTKLKNAPDFYLSSENIFHKIGQMFGYQDIDFIDSPKFSKKYLLRGKNTLDVKKYFDFKKRQFFENFNLKNETIEVKNNTLIYYRLRIKPNNYSNFIDKTKKIKNILDNY